MRQHLTDPGEEGNLNIVISFQFYQIAQSFCPKVLFLWTERHTHTQTHTRPRTHTHTHTQKNSSDSMTSTAGAGGNNMKIIQ